VLATSKAMLNIDLFSERSLKDPFEDYRTLRDHAPVVFLENLDLYAVGRFYDVQDALRRPEQLLSGKGVGFSPIFNAPAGKNVLQSDGEHHRQMRSIVAKPLSPREINQARAELKALLRTYIEDLADGAEFDAMATLASFLPLEAVAHFVGLPVDGRAEMLGWAAAAFNMIGPKQNVTDLEKVAALRRYLQAMRPEDVRPGSWSDGLFNAVRDERLSEEDARAALSAYVVPSLDTTILSQGHLLYNLASDPEQWALLCNAPDLIPNAVLEAVRHGSAIRWFARVTSDDVEISGCTIPAGRRVMLMYGSANRDERRFEDPDRFDVRRVVRDQLAWGTGPHLCVGMHLARIEMEVMLEVLVELNCELEAGPPTIGANQGLYGFEALPLRIRRRA
jgi:cytochrome P450